MSKNKSIDERKEPKSIYLAEKDWDFLYKEGNGSPTHAIRELIIFKRDYQKDNDHD